jgi:hypothetical protein
MRNIRTTQCCCLYLLACVVCACNGSTEPGGVVQLSVVVSDTIVALPDDITVTVVVHNPSPHSVSLGEECVPVGFRVLDTDSVRVSPVMGWESAFFCIGGVNNYVPPRGEREYGFFWTPVAHYGSAEATPLPPGRYQIIAGLAGEPLRPPFSEGVWVRVEAGQDNVAAGDGSPAGYPQGS